MNKNINTFGKVIILLLVCSSLWSQRYNSPYSRFGLGDFTNPNFMYTRSMGNNGSAYADATTMNPVNPASYSWLNLASYNVGFFSEYSQISDENVTEDKWTGNLEYLGLAFPLRNYKNEILDPSKKKYKLGMSFFAKPVSTISYDVTTMETIADNVDIGRKFFGTGGTYEVKWGNSIRFDNFSFGLHLGYLFGQINNNQDIFLINENATVTDEIRFNYSVRGFQYDLGALYKVALNRKERVENKSLKEKYLMIGLRGHLGNNFSTTGDYSHIGNGEIINGFEIVDTTTLTGTGRIPAKIGFGLSYFKGKSFNIGVDMEYSPYSTFENTIRPEQDFRNTLNLGIGGQFTPDDRGFGTFLERTSYGFGLYYEQDPRVIQDEFLNNYGVTIGLGMPFFYQQNFSRLNLTFDVGQRGAGSLISETFVKLGVGMNFNDDSWFIRRKYN